MDQDQEQESAPDALAPDGGQHQGMPQIETPEAPQQQPVVQENTGFGGAQHSTKEDDTSRPRVWSTGEMINYMKSKSGGTPKSKPKNQSKAKLNCLPAPGPEQPRIFNFFNTRVASRGQLGSEESQLELDLQQHSANREIGDPATSSGLESEQSSKNKTLRRV